MVLFTPGAMVVLKLVLNFPPPPPPPAPNFASSHSMTIDACAARCAREAGCKFLSYNQSTGACAVHLISKCSFTTKSDGPLTYRLPTTCPDVTVCKSGQYEFSPPGFAMDRVCAPVMLACISPLLELAAPTATSDRRCCPVESVPYNGRCITLRLRNPAAPVTVAVDVADTAPAGTYLDSVAGFAVAMDGITPVNVPLLYTHNDHKECPLVVAGNGTVTLKRELQDTEVETKITVRAVLDIPACNFAAAVNLWPPPITSLLPACYVDNPNGFMARLVSFNNPPCPGTVFVFLKSPGSVTVQWHPPGLSTLVPHRIKSSHTPNSTLFASSQNSKTIVKYETNNPLLPGNHQASCEFAVIVTVGQEVIIDTMGHFYFNGTIAEYFLDATGTLGLSVFVAVGVGYCWFVCVCVL
jgi:hypothetical protein